MKSLSKKVATLSGTGLLVLAAVIAGALIVHQGSNTNSKGITLADSLSVSSPKNSVLSENNQAGTTSDNSSSDSNNSTATNNDGSGSNGVAANQSSSVQTGNTTPNNPLPTVVTPNPVVPPIVPTAPSVSISSPAASATVAGTVAVSANASDSFGVTSVQFKLDGANLGSPVTIAPYTVSFNTATVADGTHSLTAVASNAANLSTTSAAVTVNVHNAVVVIPPVTSGTNLITNPSIEDSTAGVPNGWVGDGFGNNTHTVTYLSTGHTGSHSLNVTVSGIVAGDTAAGDAKWGFIALPASAGQSYQFSDFYQSSVDTEVDVAYTVNGVDTFALLGKAPASAAWAQFKTTFTAPAGTTAVKVYHILAANGSLTTDDYSMSAYTPVPFSRGLVSVTFDDGWTNQFQNAAPVLAANGQIATFYIISGSLGDQPDYMSAAQVASLHQAGHEIGSHTITHPDLTLATAATLTAEMQQSQATLQAAIGVPVTDFAYPYGAYNATTVAEGQKYYHSQRSVDQGFNTKDNFNINQLKIFEVDSNISQAQVQGWIDAAIAQHSWLILVYHEIAVTPTAPDDLLYTTQPTDFTAEMNYLKLKAPTATLTVNQALTELASQL